MSGGPLRSKIDAWFIWRSAASPEYRSPPTNSKAGSNSRCKDLRAQAPHATVRLSRLTQGRTDAHLDIGWLIELELDPNEPLLAGDRLQQALRDMRLLGLQPTLLTPTPTGVSTNGQAA